jgi:hypothetical protein
LPRSLRLLPRSAPQWPAAFASGSTPAAKIRRSGPPPLPWSRRRRPKTASLAGLPCRGLDIGGRDPPRWPAPYAAVSIPAAEIRRGGPPPSPRSRRRRPRSAAAVLRWPAAFATVSTPAAEIRSGGPPPSPAAEIRCVGPLSSPRSRRDPPPPPTPRSRRRRPRSAAVARRLRYGLVAGDRRPPVWSASLDADSTPATEIRRGTSRSRRRLAGGAALAAQIKRSIEKGHRGTVGVGPLLEVAVYCCN